MSAAVLAMRGRGSPPPVGARGYHVTYRGDGSDHCPGCGRRHFIVGRLTAECAFCGTVLPLPDPPRSGSSRIWRRGKGA